MVQIFVQFRCVPHVPKLGISKIISFQRMCQKVHNSECTKMYKGTKMVTHRYFLPNNLVFHIQQYTCEASGGETSYPAPIWFFKKLTSKCHSKSGFVFMQKLHCRIFPVCVEATHANYVMGKPRVIYFVPTETTGTNQTHTRISSFTVLYPTLIFRQI